jgi:hypothetical protein
MAVSAQGSFPRFETHVLDEIGRNLGQTALVDMDKDGDLDYVVGEQSNAGGRVWWFEFVAPDKWVRHDIGKGRTDVGGDCHDVKGDGWMDFWGGEILFLNCGDGTFSRHEVGTVFSHDSQFVDIDRDGTLDGISNRDARGLDAGQRSKVGLIWYSIPKDPSRPWKAHQIASAEQHEIHGGVSPRGFGDITGSGHTDVVTAQAWYENLDGKGTAWKEHKVLELGERHKYGIAVRSWVADMDADGDNDIVQAEADNPDSRVAWFENDGKGKFTRHIVKDKGDKQDFHSLAVADFNNDGRLDIFSGGGPLSDDTHTCYVWENLGDGNWREHTVATAKPCHEAVADDIDRDGDTDIVIKPWSTGNVHYFLENKLFSR